MSSLTNIKQTMLALIFFLLSSLGQAQNEQDVISSFSNIGNKPFVVKIHNSLTINNSGGHIQGIQLFDFNNNKYAILTGSSDSYSYYAVVNINNNKVVSVNRLMDKPFKHAGGCQVFQNFMAVGIEDNEAKDKSKVCIYDISNPENPAVNPAMVIERNGNPYRSTAGCVGITKYKNNILLSVGDWDTKHIDFYMTKADNWLNGNFELVFTIDTETISKEDWIDSNWFSYQNINLFTSNKNELYLVGLGQNNNNENVTDLFRLRDKNLKEFSITKIASKTMNCEKGANFKAAAGIYFSNEGKPCILSSAYNIERTTYLNFFKNQNK